MRRCSGCDHPAYRTDRYCLHCGRPLQDRPGLRAPVLAALALGAGVLVAALRAAPGGAALPPAGQARAAISVESAGPATAAPCRFLLGFQTLHDLLPARIGACLDDERYDPLSRDTVQHSSGGLLVWHKAGNVTTFTDGRTTWLLGPEGLEQRPNSERLPWEAGGPAPVR